MQIRQITQISESHCGAAVLQMLLDALGITTSQQEIAQKAGVEDSIDEHGMRVDQIATACNKIAPQMTFWYKYFSTLDDLKFLLANKIPVGVEWQGLFYDSVEEEEEEGREDAEYGHYSIVAFYDEELGQLVIIDPYRAFANRNRIFSDETFMLRWWDTNEIVDPLTGRTQIVEDNRMLFFVTSSETLLPPEMGFKQFNSIEDVYHSPQTG